MALIKLNRPVQPGDPIGSYYEDPGIAAGGPDLSAYKSFIEEGQAGYADPYGQLGMVDPGIRYDPRQHSYASDLYSYYLGGGRGAGDAAGIMTQAPGTTVQGTTYLTETGEPAAGPGTGITAAGIPTPIMPPTSSPFVETAPNVLTPTNIPGTPIVPTRGGAQVIVDPTTGDTYAPGDYTDVAGTLADPREKIDTLAPTGGRDIPDVRQYADRSWNVDYEALDQEGQAEIDQAYADLYGIDTEVKQPFIDQALDFYQELPTPGGIIVKALRGEDEPKDETIYGDQPVVPGTVFDAEDYGDPSIMDAPDLLTTPPTLPGGYELPGGQRDLGGPSMPTGTLGPPSLTADTTDEGGFMTKEEYDKATAGMETGEAVFDERLGWVDSGTGLPVDDPKKTETDIALAGLEHMSTYDKVEFNALKKNKALGIKLTPKQEERLKELQKKRDYKPEVKPISLVDLTEGDEEDITTPITPPAAGPFDYLQDDITPTPTPTPTGGPPGGGDPGMRSGPASAPSAPAGGPHAPSVAPGTGARGPAGGGGGGGN